LVRARGDREGEEDSEAFHERAEITKRSIITMR
jgi:hypothetical protein